MNDADLKTAAFAPDLVQAPGTSLAPVSGGGASFLEPLSHRVDALQIIERQGQIFQAVQVALLRLTTPEDWTAQRVDGADHLTPTGTAVNKIRQFLSLEVEILSREHVQRTRPGGAEAIPGVEVRFRTRSLVYGSLCGLTPQQVPWIELATTRWADEDFTGRKVDTGGALVRGRAPEGATTLSSDLAGSADSAARNRAFRQITGMDKVPLAVAAKAWGLSNDQALARAKRGYGFGNAQNRAAEGVAEEGVGAEAKKLWDECLRQANGDVKEATAILQEITAYPAWENKAKGTSGKAFTGNTSYQQITKSHFVTKAWEKLRARSQREPGVDE